MKTQADKKDLFNRDPNLYETDKAAVEAIVQAAVNVELFTIPLYMTTLYSIQGVHQITGQNDLYQGRLWPGLAPTFRPGTRPSKNIPENEKAFNTIFSVFIEEMLHLQLASNLATAVGVVPKFTQLSPQTVNYAWKCYGPESTVIPGIVDFKDCKEVSNGINYSKIRVKLDDLNITQNDLFLAIEAPEEEAKARIKESELHKYFPITPFKDWQPGDELPMFGSIGQMYQCLWDYLDIQYEDDDGKVTSLWEKIYRPASIQQDIFNATSQGHPYKEFQGLDTTVEGWLPEKAKELIYKLICAITDQGEGADISKNLYGAGLQAVQPDNQASNVALKADYPSFTDTGKPAPSTHAYARYGNGKQDHYERFEEIRDDLNSGKIVTWPTWHKTVRPGPDKWKPEDLKTEDYDQNQYPLPKAEEIAAALNRLNDPSGTGDLNDPKRAANYKQFCEIATGAIAGITTVLDQFWANPGVGFPFPSMGGSGDRLMMCWAVFGQLPNLAQGVQPIKKDVLYHACQGLDLNQPATADSTCASAEIYHNCRGSNSCKAQGGCGFVQQVGQSKSCNSSVMSLKIAENLCGGPTPTAPLYSAPGDNLCSSFGGCAVPISASQIYPVISTLPNGRKVTSGNMELDDFTGPSHDITKLPGTIPFNTGDLVHDIAWNAYTAVLESRKQTVPAKPKTSDIRLAFPPST